MIVAACLLCVILLSSSAFGAQASCLKYVTCASCTAASACGWANGVVCYPGTASGASPPYSSNISWAWTPSQCPSSTPAPPACLQYSTCLSCTATSGCGWANGVVCYPGTASGASPPYSSNISWAWTTGQCSSRAPATPAPAGCLQYTTCPSCTAASACGWANGVVCYPGTASGASPPYSSNISWAWTSSQCPSSTPAPSSCLQYSTCLSCTMTSGCGWANGVVCYPGTSSGASYPYSSNISWAWSSSQCQAADGVASEDQEARHQFISHQGTWALAIYALALASAVFAVIGVLYIVRQWSAQPADAQRVVEKPTEVVI